MNNVTDKEVQMKRIITAAALALLAIPAFADEANAKGQPSQSERTVLPFEQTQLDRGFLADVADGASSSSGGATVSARSSAYWRQFDGGVPANTVPHDHAVKTDPVWSKDPQFIAPPL